MPLIVIRTVFVFFFTCQVLTAQALLVLPEECQLAGFDPSCEATEGPHDSAIGQLVGEAIMHKLIESDPQLALPLFNSGFLQNWSAAWTSFPVPEVVETIIAGLSSSDFDQWIDWLCINLHPNTAVLPIIDFEQMPQVVVNSLPQTPASAVPAPAAAWLFASAIVALVSVGRNRTQH